MGSGHPGVKYSEALGVHLRPSRLARAFVEVAVLATTVLGVVTPLPAWASISILLAMLLATRRALAVLFEARRVQLDRSRSVLVLDRAGRWRGGALVDGSFVAPWLTIIRWRPDGAWFDRTILVVPDMIQGEDFRHLRVLLKHCQTGETI